MLALAVAIPTLSRGGFDSSAQATFAVLAGVALLIAGVIDADGALAAARSPIVLTLSALALLSVASALWTIASVADAVRWGLVIAGYGAVCVISATVARGAGPWPVATGIATLAALEAINGLVAVTSRAIPDAQQLSGVWQPGGTFEYTPALALLEVGALPVFVLGTARRRLAARAGALGGATLVGAVLGLTGSRLAPAAAAVILLWLIFRGSPGPRPRRAPIAAAVCVLAGAMLASSLLSAHTQQAHTPSRHRHAPQGTHRASLPAFRGATPDRSILHGRGYEWNAAVETWLDQPLLGAGAGAYYVASFPHQTLARSRFAHDLPLELAAELGIVGLALGIALYAATAWTILQAADIEARWLFAPLVTVFMLANLVDWPWHLAGLGAIWAAAAGALHATTHTASPSHAPRSSSE